MPDNSPIGVLDSGMGGLSVFSEIVKLLPHESVIYYGDGKNCPYGKKTAEEVLSIADDIVKVLLAKGVKLIVLACNTATANAIDRLRATYDIPFVGMEPAVKPAAMNTRTGVVGILATAPTLTGKLFRETSDRYSDRVKILPEVGEGFVELVEADREDSPEAEDAVRKVIAPLIEAGADQLVLGCTHYPFLGGAMRKVIGGRDVDIVNPAPAVARRVMNLLSDRGLLAEDVNIPEYRFYTGSDDNYLQRIKNKAATLF